MTDSGGVKKEVLPGFQFPSNKTSMASLKVTLIKIENLADEDHIGKSDPYVKFEVEKDNFGPFDQTIGTAESSHKKDDQNPVYNEDFTFGMPELKKHVLKIKVMDDDIGSDEKLGKAEIKLDQQGLTPGVPKEIKVKVDDNWFSKDAYCYLRLTWNP